MSHRCPRRPISTNFATRPSSGEQEAVVVQALAAHPGEQRDQIGHVQAGALARPRRRGRSGPRAASAVRSPQSSAWCMVWVTISVVRRSSATSRGSGRARTRRCAGRARPCARRAAGSWTAPCVAISRLTAWRCPPESRPIRSPSRLSRPRPSAASRSRQRSRPVAGRPPRRSPRAAPARLGQRQVLLDRQRRAGAGRAGPGTRAPAAAPARRRASAVTSAPSIAIRPRRGAHGRRPAR